MGVEMGVDAERGAAVGLWNAGTGGVSTRRSGDLFVTRLSGEVPSLALVLAKGFGGASGIA
jgi:hypothetical protein